MSGTRHTCLKIACKRRLYPQGTYLSPVTGEPVGQGMLRPVCLSQSQQIHLQETWSPMWQYWRRGLWGWLGYSSRAFINGIDALKEKTPESSLVPLPAPLPRPLPECRTARHECLLCKPPHVWYFGLAAQMDWDRGVLLRAEWAPSSLGILLFPSCHGPLWGEHCAPHSHPGPQGPPCCGLPSFTAPETCFHKALRGLPTGEREADLGTEWEILGAIPGSDTSFLPAFRGQLVTCPHATLGNAV